MNGVPSDPQGVEGQCFTYVKDRSMDSPYYVYILRCADGPFYVGSTHDVTERVARYNDGRTAKSS